MDDQGNTRETSHRERFITERIHERIDHVLEARVKIARERLENAEIPLYQRVIMVQQDQQDRQAKGRCW